MIDIFTKQDFESVLPESIQSLGLVSNEYCYLLPVTENAGILIRSSISSTGYSDAVGEDSIRVYPTFIEILYHVQGKAVYAYNLQGHSEHRWITRQAGWQNRLQYTVKKLSRMIQDAGSCSECGKPLKILKVKKEGANKGKWFATCEREHDQFKWLEEE